MLSPSFQQVLFLLVTIRLIYVMDAILTSIIASVLLGYVMKQISMEFTIAIVFFCMVIITLLSFPLFYGNINAVASD